MRENPFEVRLVWLIRKIIGLCASRLFITVLTFRRLMSTIADVPHR